MIPSVSAACRRLHDINKSGWWQSIPIYNLILWAEDSSSGTPQRSSSQSRNYSKPTRSSSGKNDLTDELEERVGSAGVTVNSTMKIDTIAEKTSGSGVTIDGLNIKDGAVAGAVDIGLVIALG